MTIKKIIFIDSSCAAASSLKKMLSRASKLNGPQSSDETLRSVFVGLSQKTIPRGALGSFALEISNQTKSENWCCIDLISCQIDQKAAYVLGSASEDKTHFHQKINKLLAEDGMKLHLTQNNQWYCQLPPNTELVANDLSTIIGKCLSLSLPENVYWRRLLTELQMLCASIAPNQNLSLWFWGIGSLPENIQTDYDEVYSNDPTILGLAKCAKVKHGLLSDNLLDSDITFVLPNGEKYYYTKNHRYYFWRRNHARITCPEN